VSVIVTPPQSAQTFLYIMLKRIFLLFLFNSIGWTAATAQITNPSFTDGLNGWATVGSPTTGSDDPPGGTYANISSTNDPGLAAPADVLASALHLASLPNTDIIYLPTDGQAIYQYFTLSQAAMLSFKYAYSTFDIYPQDSAGMTLDGNYTEFQQTPAQQQTTPSGYMTVSNIELQPGEHQLGFVSYNTGDNTASTHIYITDIELTAVPEPAPAILLAMGIAGLALLSVRRLAVRPL